MSSRKGKGRHKLAKSFHIIFHISADVGGSMLMGSRYSVCVCSEVLLPESDMYTFTHTVVT